MSGFFRKDKDKDEQSHGSPPPKDDRLPPAAESLPPSQGTPPTRKTPEATDPRAADSLRDTPAGIDGSDADWADVDRTLSLDPNSHEPSAHYPPTGGQPTDSVVLQSPRIQAADSPLSLVETAFLASTASLLWLISYYLSIGPWMRILFPTPIALVYLRWGQRAAWMSAIVSCLLLSVLMGPYLSLLFLIPYGLLGVQLGALWQRRSGWVMSIAMGTIVATFSFFFRIWLLSSFLGEDVWVYLTGRITDLLEWFATLLVDWGILGVGMLGQPDLTLVQLATIAMIVCSDIVYLFTVHLAAWLMLERLGNPIPAPPRWVQVLLDEAD